MAGPAPRKRLDKAIVSPGTGSAADEFLRRRLTIFGAIGAGLTVVRVAVAWLTAFSTTGDPLAMVRQPCTSWLSGITTVAFLAIAVTANRLHSRRWLEVLDAVGIVLICSIATWASCFLGLPGFDGFQPLLVVVLVLMWRAAIVPSHPVRTLVLGLVCAIANQSAAFVNALESSAAIMEIPSRVSWLAVSVAGTTAVSFVIYRLQRRARKAEQLGQYELLEKIGGGGMGDVYRARHALMCRPVAVKLLRADGTDVKASQRFEREVRLTSALKHPNTITIYDFGQTAEGRFFYVMEYLIGRDLDQVLRHHGALPARRVVHLLRQVCASLAEAHAKDLIHRDIKPANLILCEQGGIWDFVKVVDFGLVKSVRNAAEKALTADMSLLGTPLYLSPESIRGVEAADGRSDLYALGCVSWNLLTGKRLFDAESIFEICQHHVSTPAPRPSLVTSATISPELDALILSCLEKDPARRPQSARALERLLAACPEADRWTQDEAEAWWRENPCTSEPPTRDTASMYVDLASREEAEDAEDARTLRLGAGGRTG